MKRSLVGFVARTVTLCLAVLFIAATLSHVAHAQRTVSYQGVILKNGMPVSGSLQIHVAVYDAQTGGSKFFEETHQANLSPQGVFNIQLGSINKGLDTLHGDRDYWVGVSLAGDDELPRTQLSATLFAVNAGHAQIADGLAPNARGVITSINELSGGIHIVGDSTIAVTSPNSNVLELHVLPNGAYLTSVATMAPELAGTGLPNDPVRLTAQGATPGQSLIFNGSNWTPGYSVIN